jgi:ribosomal-protein-alanine N-acetyltransferase
MQQPAQRAVLKPYGEKPKMKPESFFTRELPTLQTTRLLLRDVQIADAEAIYAYSSNPVFYQCLGRKIPPSLEHVASNIQRQLEKNSRMPRNWMIVLTDENRLIGDCGFNDYRPDNSRAEINCAVDPAYWSRGIATEAALCVLEFAFEQLQFSRIQAICSTANKRSEAVLKKLGMQYEGLLRRYIQFENQPLDMKMFSILKNE